MQDQHAIVIGASMGGLLAARALTRHFAKVTVIERDSFPDGIEPRKGVPQGRHTHGLLARGREALEAFFPGLTAELTRKGAELGDIAGDVAWYNEGRPLRQFSSGMLGLLASRPLLEAHVRGRLMQMRNADIVSNCDVVGLVADEPRQRVTGVEIKRNGKLETLTADLVVDASGRGSRSAAWLMHLGYEAPAETRIEIGITYLTRSYRRKPDQCGGMRGVVVAGSAPNWRNGALLAQEGDRWIMSIGGFFGDEAPRDEEGFLAYARSLPAPQFAEIIRDAEPIGDFAPYKFSADLRRHYEDLKRFPQGYLVFGDALCSFNPVYGQGMTVASLEAIALDDCLAARGDDLARRFFEKARALIDTPWSIAVGNDLRHPQVQGRRSPMVRFINWYVAKLTTAAEDDADLAVAFLKVANLIDPPASLLKPATALKVWRGTRGRAKSPAERDAASFTSSTASN